MQEVPTEKPLVAVKVEPPTYTVVGPHLVHNATGLKWLIRGPREVTDWRGAKAYAKGLGKGWRLPTLDELSDLRDHYEEFPDNCPWDKLPRQCFTGTPFWLPKRDLMAQWIDTTVVYDNFTDGYHIDHRLHVIPVQGDYTT